jgi:hypothetical protein
MTLSASSRKISLGVGANDAFTERAIIQDTSHIFNDGGSFEVTEAGFLLKAAAGNTLNLSAGGGLQYINTEGRIFQYMSETTSYSYGSGYAKNGSINSALYSLASDYGGSKSSDSGFMVSGSVNYWGTHDVNASLYAHNSRGVSGGYLTGVYATVNDAAHSIAILSD